MHEGTVLLSQRKIRKEPSRTVYNPEMLDSHARTIGYRCYCCIFFLSRTLYIACPLHTDISITFQISDKFSVFIVNYRFIKSHNSYLRLFAAFI